MRFTEEDIEKLIYLSRIECDDEEKEKLRTNLEKILGYFAQLNEVPTENVPPCNSVLEGHIHPMREDEVGELLPRDVFLSNAPQHVGGMIKVPPILKL